MKTFTEEEQKYLEGMDLSSLPIHAAPVLIAVGQYDKGKQITTKCPYCQSSIEVKSQGNPTAVWFHSCNCGKCKGTMKGL